MIFCIEDYVAQEETDQSSFNSEFIVYIIMSIFAIIIIISYIYSFISYNDFYSLGSLITSAIQIIDTVSDALFIINISNHSDYPSSTTLVTLVTLSVLFLVFPIIITLYQLFYHIKKWQRNDALGEWISENVTLLYVLSIIIGSSFAAVSLCTCNAFNLGQFDMPLSSMELQKYEILNQKTK